MHAISSVSPIERLPTVPEKNAENLALMVKKAALMSAEEAIIPKGRKQLLAYAPKSLLCHAAMKKPVHNSKLCTGCRACVGACPTGAVSADLSVNNSRCIRCFACVQTCCAQARKRQFTNPVTKRYVTKKREVPELVIYPKGLC